MREIFGTPGDIASLALKEHAFDLVTLHQVLHYFDDPRAVIREAARMLSKGGQLIVVDFRAAPVRVFSPTACSSASGLLRRGTLVLVQGRRPVSSSASSAGWRPAHGHDLAGGRGGARLSNLLDHLSRSVLLCDGAGYGSSGTGPECRKGLRQPRKLYRHPDAHTAGSHPLHPRELSSSGADILKTNTFGASPVTLGEFGIGAEAFALNRESAELAREAVEQFADGRKRYVLGGIGPGTKLPSLGHIEYQTLEDALTIQCAGLIAGRIDAFLIETCRTRCRSKPP